MIKDTLFGAAVERRLEQVTGSSGGVNTAGATCSCSCACYCTSTCDFGSNNAGVGTNYSGNDVAVAFPEP